MNLTPHRCPPPPASPPAGRPRQGGLPARLAAEHRLQRLTRLQTTLAEAHAEAERRERERMAQLLHDQVGGLIVRLRLALGDWRRTQADGVGADASCGSDSDSGSDAGSHADAASGAVRGLGGRDATQSHPATRFGELLGELSETVRTLAFALAPPDWHGDLPTALEAVAVELGLRGTLEVRIDGRALSAADTAEVPDAQRAAACRVVRELCLNVQKHARATRIEITPKIRQGWLSVRVRDDGRGLPTVPRGAHRPEQASEVDWRGAADGHGLGLGGARAQLQAMGGALVLRSEPGRGTSATLLLPLAPK
nr:ATP-binding protein [uncultured Roseateles sp.]